MPTTRSIHIDRLAYGAHGVGRIDGKVTFVRGVVPGEDAEVVVREEHDRYAYADVVRLVTTAPERRDPPCPHLPRCGGCPWQHLDYAAQLRAKEANLSEALARIGHWHDAPVRPIIPAPHELHYRGRLSLRVDQGNIGFYAAASHDLVTIDRCLLAGDPVDAAMSAAADLVRALPDHVRRIEIAACEESGAVVLVGEVEGPQRPRTGPIVERWLVAQPIAGVTLHGRRWRRSWGTSHVAVLPEPGVKLTASAGVFTQVHPAANRALVREVVELANVSAECRILDLYAGIGNLTIPLARRAGHVTAVEQDRHAAANARANAAVAGLDNVEVRSQTSRAALGELVAAGTRFDTVVLDPPRSGAADALDAIVALAPERIVYVSCNPATLARDVARLRKAFDFDVVQPMDLFPQTYHLETVVRGHRRRARG
mgnify:CR=1 FL=1